MTKFVFRSLAREHPEPSELMRIANQVVLDEVEEGKFVTMLYLTVDPATGEVACSGAGHPEPRVVRPDGSVEELEARRLALGIAPDQQYPEARTTLEPGASVVLFTDGVGVPRRRRALREVEARPPAGGAARTSRTAAGPRGRRGFPGVRRRRARGRLAVVVVKKTS